MESPSYTRRLAKVWTIVATSILRIRGMSAFATLFHQGLESEFLQHGDHRPQSAVRSQILTVEVGGETEG
jgi:hypothetical protein